MIRFVKLSETASKVSYEFHSSLGEYGTFDIDKNTHEVLFNKVLDFDRRTIDANKVSHLLSGINHIIDEKFPDEYTCAWC